MSKTTKQFKRQFFGYRRSAVDDHLATVDASIAELQEAVDKAAQPEHQDLVLRATRRAVEDVMQRAHDDATRIRDEAAAEAAQVLADAYAVAERRDEVIDLRPAPPVTAGAAEEPIEVAAVDDDPLEVEDDRDEPEIDLASPADESGQDSPDAIDELLDVAAEARTDDDPVTETDTTSMGSLEEPPADPEWNADLAKVITD